MDSLDSVWLGMKLGVAVIGMGMMGFFWRGIWRSKRAGEQKHRKATPRNPRPRCAPPQNNPRLDSASQIEAAIDGKLMIPFSEIELPLRLCRKVGS